MRRLAHSLRDMMRLLSHSTAGSTTGNAGASSSGPATAGSLALAASAASRARRAGRPPGLARACASLAETVPSGARMARARPAPATRPPRNLTACGPQRRPAATAAAAAPAASAALDDDGTRPPAAGRLVEFRRDGRTGMALLVEPDGKRNWVAVDER